ncbi:THAP domain-containing protein 1 isoform X4 [Chanodichthys erythropterus]|uniref:THAP domain-containing protein 1 isoform X4 n=1 Tax=Chanodichthys erythropterus TaxID=933992 RepID=UPI00351E5F86
MNVISVLLSEYELSYKRQQYSEGFATNSTGVSSDLTVRDTHYHSEAASLEDAFSPDMDFPLSLPLSDAEETAVVRPSETEPEPNPDLHASACVSCDHNYTVEDTVQQKRRIEQLQEQLEKLRKRLKTVQQKCRRQERQLERYRAVSQIRKTGKKDVTPGESYVILPREMYDVLKGIETIGAL